jgi:hypothetical protein
MKEVFLSRAKEVFLFDSRVAGWDSQSLRMYDDVLSSFIRFTGDIRVRQLTPDLMRMYFVNLSDGPDEGEEHSRLVVSQYAMIQMWIHWMYSQKLLIERTSDISRSPHLIDLFPLQFTRCLPTAI